MGAYGTRISEAQLRKIITETETCFQYRDQRCPPNEDEWLALIVAKPEEVAVGQDFRMECHTFSSPNLPAKTVDCFLFYVREHTESVVRQCFQSIGLKVGRITMIGKEPAL